MTFFCRRRPSFYFYRRRWKERTNWLLVCSVSLKIQCCASTNEPKRFLKYGHWRQCAAGPRRQTRSPSILATTLTSTTRFRQPKANRFHSSSPDILTLFSKRYWISFALIDIRICAVCSSWPPCYIHYIFFLSFRNKPRIISVLKATKDPTLSKTVSLLSSN